MEIYVKGNVFRKKVGYCYKRSVPWQWVHLYGNLRERKSGFFFFGGGGGGSVCVWGGGGSLMMGLLTWKFT